MKSFEEYRRPRGLMDKASVFGTEDCEFESRRGRAFFFYIYFLNITMANTLYYYFEQMYEINHFAKKLSLSSYSYI